MAVHFKICTLIISKNTSQEFFFIDATATLFHPFSVFFFFFFFVFLFFFCFSLFLISIKGAERAVHVIGAVQVNQSDQIVMITDLGRLVRTRVSEVNFIRRITQGVMLIRTACDECVVGLQCVVESV